jgi:hypothetical protein
MQDRLKIERRRLMFGKMSAAQIINLEDPAHDNRGSLDRAVERLLALTAKWVQFPKALFLFLVVPEDSESGAFYVYDRRSRIWFWIDFEDEKFGGYNTSDFEHLVRECRFLDIAENPHLLRSKTPWMVRAGSRPEIAAQA